MQNKPHGSHSDLSFSLLRILRHDTSKQFDSPKIGLRRTPLIEYSRHQGEMAEVLVRHAAKHNAIDRHAVEDFNRIGGVIREKGLDGA